MSAKEAALFDETQSERKWDNPLACFVMADLLEKEGSAELVFCYRWMGWHGRQLGYRGAARLR